MKLWQKIFLAVFVLMVVCISVTGDITIIRSYWMMVDTARDRAASEMEYIASGLNSQVLYERLLNDNLWISEDKVNEIIEKWMEENGGQLLFIYSENPDTGVLYEKEKTAAAAALGGQTGQRSEKLAGQIEKTDQRLSEIVSENERHYILTGIRWEPSGRIYYLITWSDISDIYQSVDSQLRFQMIFGAVLSLVAGGVLIVMVIRMLEPLRRINRGLRVIAKGRYQTRLPEKKWSPEMRELAQNINVMAQSVENHTEKLKLQAENRRQFVDSLAHEMKTPLTSILGFADMLRISRKIPEEKKAEYADIIFEEAKRLKNLSGKLMELSMTKHVDLDVAMVSAKELVLELKKTLAPLLAQKRARLLTKTEDMLVPMDRELMKSVFYNLIENACKASKDGQSILFTAERQDDQAVFRVTDKGIGMSEKDVKMAMEPFFMVDKLASRQAGGTGLGLMLCFEIVRQHKGRIHIDSQIGKGTTVTVSLPLSVPPEEDKDEKEEARG